MPITCPHCGGILRHTKSEMEQARYEEREPLRQLAKELWENGLTQKAIGAQLCMSQNSARNLLLSAGVDTSKKPHRIATAQALQRAQRLKDAIEMRETDGKTFRQIGEVLGVGAQRANQIYKKACRFRKRGLLPEHSKTVNERS